MARTGCPVMGLRGWGGADAAQGDLFRAPAEGGGALAAWGFVEVGDGRSSGERAAADWLGTPSRI